MKAITLIGSTGSIGTQTLDIVSKHPDKFRIVGLAAGRNVELFAAQIRQFRPQIAAISAVDKLPELQEAIKDVYPQPILLAGETGVIEVARYGEAQTVVTGIVGCAGLLPTIAAIEAGRDIALANKETIIAGAPVVLPLVEKHGVKLLPADSEHSAIFQCLQGVPQGGLRKILLTASGGAFRDWPVEKLPTVKVADAIKHPNWSMGRKITVDSATLMNKGLEVIEAKWLFGLKAHQIEVIVHPQSIIHSLVQFRDSSIKAQLGLPDMRLPIQFALGYPERLNADFPRFDFSKYPSLTFEKPDTETFRNLALAFEALHRGGNMPCVLNAANEVAVEEFLNDRLGFLQMSELVEQCMKKISFVTNPSLQDYIETNRETRARAKEITKQL